ncbi:MAG: histidine kinase [Betaproteobacteria bacterium]|nr:histidine kinase [Betaproteobacteria bacterium]
MSSVPAGGPYTPAERAAREGESCHSDPNADPDVNPGSSPGAAQPARRRKARFSLRLMALLGDSAPVRASLFGEILDWLLVPLLLLWPISVALTYVATKSLANAPFDRALGNQAQLLADYVKIDHGHAVLALPPAARELLRADEIDQVYYQVLGRQGESVAGERELPAPDDEDLPAPGQVQYRNGYYKGAELRIALLAVELPDAQRLADGPAGRPPLVQVAETLEKRSQLAGELVKGVILPQFVILPVAVLLVWFGLARGLVPLSRLTERIRARKPADLSPIDPGAAPEEVAPLIRSINDLMHRLEASLHGQQRFVANAAHQLRTPLAGLKTQTELAMRLAGPGGRSGSDSAELVDSLRQMALSTERAARMVNQLLALTRAEREGRGAAGAALVAVDLDELLREQVRGWVPAAMERRIDLGVDGPEAVFAPLFIDGDPVLLRELVNNLLDNAIRYTPAGGIITARVRRDQALGLAWIEIEDNGIGIAEAERDLVFERFYRVLGNDPEVRNLEGSGLGLSIVREIATRHRGRVTLRDNPAGAGTVFCVSFPLLGSGRPALPETTDARG